MKPSGFYLWAEVLMKNVCMIKQWDRLGLVSKVISHKPESYIWKVWSASGKGPSQLRGHTARRCQRAIVGTDLLGTAPAPQLPQPAGVLCDRRLTRFRSMAASGPVIARCTQPETDREELERFSPLLHGYLFLSRHCNNLFSIPLLQNPTMFSFCVYLGCSVSL